MKKTILSGWLAICLMTLPLMPHAAGLTTGADFLLVNTGARPDALGGAFSAVADDINTLSYNPAGLANITLPEVGYGRYEFVSGIHFDFVGAAIPLGGMGVIGLGYMGNQVAAFNSTADPMATPVSASERALMFGWGKSFNRLHLGAAVKSVTRRIGPVNGTAVMADFGFRFRLNPRLFFAGSLMNAGSDIRIPEPEKPPTTARAGLAWRAVERYPHRLDLAMDGRMPLGSQLPVYGWGAEYCYREHYALRGGWVGNSEAEGLTAGAGLKVNFFQLDYAFQPYNELGLTHRVSGILRWNGPWLQGTVPNPPKYVQVRNMAGGLEVRWEKPTGLVDTYEVQLRSMDGGAAQVYANIAVSPFRIPDLKPGALYSITLRSVSQGGKKSYQTQSLYAEGSSSRGEGSRDFSGPSVSRGVEGAVDAAGLRLTWNDSAEPDTQFHLYVKSPSGSIRRMTAEPLPTNLVWLADAYRFGGYEFIVTLVNTKDAAEKTVGTFRWHPTNDEKKALSPEDRLRLKATPQGNGKIFLDWDKDPQAAGYTLLYSAGTDGPYRRFGELPKNKAWAIVIPKRPNVEFRFMVVSHDASGNWLKGSRDMDRRAEGLASNPPVEEMDLNGSVVELEGR